MLRGILITVLSVVVIGTAVWGYQEHKEKNAILVHAENNYQRAFHDLAYHVDLLHDQIGTTLAMNSQKTLSPALADVWRLSSNAHSDVGQLPLALLPFNKTEDFLKNVGDFSYQTAVRDLNKKPLSKDEYNKLEKLYGQSENIQNELRKVQNMVLKKNLKWMDVETALASGKENQDNAIIDGFKTVENTSNSYEETANTEPQLVNYSKRDEHFKQLKGKSITKQQAIKRAEDLADVKNPIKTKVSSSGKGAKFPFYSVALVDKEKNEINVDITKKGSFPLYYIKSRDVGKQKLSLNEAAKKASTFLAKLDLTNMKEFESSQYDHIGVFSFAVNNKGVMVYPESVKVKIALDNGEVIGFVAQDYILKQNQTNLPQAKLTLKQAKEYIGKNVKIMQSNKAIIINDLNKEVLCYEFLGTHGKDTYRIFINADNGEEEKVEKIKDVEPVL